LIDEIFDGKGAAYGAGDWVSILRFHVVLGKIFEIGQKWGSTSEPRSAIFQWNSALKAEAEVRRRNPQFPPSPALHYSLGVAYRETKDLPRAWDEFVRASQGYVDTKNLSEAARALNSARSIPIPMDPVRQRRLDALDKAVSIR
jgi:hypothetical protein